MKALPAETGVSARKDGVRHWTRLTNYTQRTVVRVGIGFRGEDLLQVEHIARSLLQILSNE